MSQQTFNKAKISDAIEDIKKGIPIIVVDNENRENEGDLVLAAEMSNLENIAFCMRYARGLMCIPCEGKRLDKLNIPMMVESTEDPLETPFTISVDAKETNSGMSVYDRLKTINVLVDDNSLPNDLQRPGHMFPLRPRDGLLEERQGHTESSIELMKLAGLKQISIIVEIINDDGTMAKGDELELFSKDHNLKIVTIDDIIAEIYNKSI